MEFNQLEYVVEVADLGSFSKAAESLFYTQPALTQQISKLEKELGVRIFNRSHGQVSLTEAGSSFLKYAKCMIDQKREALKEMDDYALNQKGSILVLLPMERGTEILSLLYPRIHKKFPNIRLSAIQTSVHRQIDRISNGTADLGFVHLPDDSALSALDYHVLANEPFLFAVSPEMLPLPYTADSAVSVDALPVLEDLSLLSEISFIFSQPYTSSSKLIMQFFRQHNISPNVIMTCNSNEAILELVQQQVAAGIVPSWYRRKVPSLAYFRLPGGLNWNFYTIWKKGSYRSNASFLFENLLTAHLQNGDLS